MSQDDPINKAIKAWQPYYDHELTQRDGEEIVENWAAYIKLLSDWAVTQEQIDTDI